MPRPAPRPQVPDDKRGYSAPSKPLADIPPPVDRDPTSAGANPKDSDSESQE